MQIGRSGRVLEFSLWKLQKDVQYFYFFCIRRVKRDQIADCSVVGLRLEALCFAVDCMFNNKADRISPGHRQ